MAKSITTRRVLIEVKFCDAEFALLCNVEVMRCLDPKNKEEIVEF